MNSFRLALAGIPFALCFTILAEPPPSTEPGKTPTDSLTAMKFPPGFSAQLLAAEPDIVQPVAFCIDDRGRMWVLQNTNYPNCPGEKKDAIVILEDTKGAGQFDKRTVFYDKLTFATGIEVGFGGVWVGAPPNLLFFPCKDGEEKPDGEPQVVLDGWGSEDTHETLNDFAWGPDGWLYGTHGVFTHSKVGAPGTPENERVEIDAAVWRYHPVTKKFERFCEGGSNQWGIDWNDHGQAFFSACVIPHLWHAVQGARYQRQGGPHLDKFTYDDIKTIAPDHKHNAAAFCGSMVYLGGLFPEKLRDTIFFSNIHRNQMNNDVLERKGSGFAAKEGPDFLVANDGWYRGLSPQYGPDGCVYVTDWYDRVPCYQQRADVDRSNGRFYKIAYQGAKPVKVSMQQSSDQELVKYQLEQNDWFVRHARRILQERGGSKNVHAELAEIVNTNGDETRKLRAMWALHCTGGFSREMGLALLKSPMEYVRAWSIQLMMEAGNPSPEMLAEFARLAKEDASPVVRLYLASAMQRMAPAQRWEIAEGLCSHAEDEKDCNIPQMIWFGIEPSVPLDKARASKLAGGTKIKVLRQFVARRLAEAAK